MAVEILSSKSKTYLRILRKKTRNLRFLYHLIQLQIRIWLAPIFPFKKPLSGEYPDNPWKGNIDKGNSFLRGEFCAEMGGDQFEDKFWQCVLKLPINMQRKLHEFQWLRHLSVCKDRQKASELARSMVDDWHLLEDVHSSVSQQVTTRAERLAHCFCYHGFLAEGASDKWLQKQRIYYHTEVLMLADILRRKGIFAGFSVLKVLLFSTILMPSMKFLRKPVNRITKEALKVRFFEDGGHRTRSPEFQRWDISTLLEIRAAMKSYKMPISPKFDDALQRGLDALASFMHGDGKLACFNGSIEQPVDIFTNLWQVWRKPKPLPQKILPNMGYVYIKRGESTVIYDVGYCPKVVDTYSHIEPLAFEFSRSGARFVVNCGTYRGEEDAWKYVGCSTAAHSTLSLDNFDACGTAVNGDKFKLGHCSVEESDKGISAIADHYGYADMFGYVHERELILSEDGKLIRGIDRLRETARTLASANEAVENIFIRFHLHPSVSVEKMAPQAVTLKLKNDELWNFSVDDESLIPLVEDSVYLGENGVPEPTMQLVITVPIKDVIDNEQNFAWKFELNRA